MRPDVILDAPIWLAGMVTVGVAIAGAAVVELALRRVLPAQIRRDHSGAGAAVFTVIGTTYAVLLAFVAMLAFDFYTRAAAVTDTEASLAQNVYQLVAGLNGPDATAMRHDIVAYAQAVAGPEWAAQAHGLIIAEDQPNLERLTRIALHLRPGSVADGNLHALLLDDLTRLADARRARLLAARSHLPGIVWFVLIAGGGITVACASLLGAPSARMQLVLSALLAMSGALVLVVILALSNPFRGDYAVTAAPFEHLLMRMVE